MLFRFKILVLLFLILIVFSTSVWSQPVWEKEPFKIFLKDNILMLFHGQSEIM